MIKIFAKNPANGGKPAIEKNKINKEKDQLLLTLNKFEKEIKNNGDNLLLKKVLIDF